MDSHKSSASAYWTNAINTRLDPLDAAIATKSASERMEVLEKIHSEVRAIEAAVTLAKRRLNAALPVGRLHSEILGLDFEHCALDEPFFIEDERITIPPDRPHGLGWIRVTHVSRRWREVALAHPSLWSIITFSNGTTWAEESVRRCKAAPMFIDISHRYNLPREVLSRILASKMQQVHTLQLMTATRRDLPSSILSHPAPNLRTFRSTMWYFSGASLPSGLFAGQTPSLRTLDIKVSSNVDWNAPILNNLTTLNIQVSPPSATSAFSQSRIQDVLGALRRMPLLETLVLEIPKVQGVGDSLPDTSGVYLPRLGALELYDMRLAAVAVFLRHIHPPPRRHNRYIL
ncbi:hypothetical protein OF83DRAFT_51222 [Amylostereum chailletii]|nr:hypothetical protein OF83DRAFT_51222 [Amylostereum chailletii]